MAEVSFDDLALVMAVAFATPIVLGLLPRNPVPTVVVEVVLGIAAGPSGLGWVEADEVVRIVAVIGLAFLLFLAGIELDLRALRGTVLRLGLAGFAVSLALAGMTGFALDAAGLVEDPLLAGVILTATSLGVVIGVLKESGRAMTPTGQLIIAGASIGDVAAVVLLSVLFSADGSGTGAQVVLLVEYAVIVAAIAGAIALAGRSMGLGVGAGPPPGHHCGDPGPRARSCSWSSSWSSPSASGSRPSSGRSWPGRWSV